MRTLHDRPICLSLLSSALLLSACGGGGGGGGGNGAIDPAPTRTPLAITSSNYQTVAAQAVGTGSYLMDAGAGNVLGVDAQALPQPLRIARDQALQLPALFAQGQGPMVVGATSTVNQPCSMGGSIEITVTDANNNQSFDAGDGMTLKAMACRQAEGTLDGSMEYALKAGSGTFGSSQYSATLGVKLNNLRVTSSVGTQTGHGEFQMTIAATGAGAATLTMSIPTFITSGTVSGSSYQSSLSGFYLSVSTTPVGFGYRSTLSFGGTINSTALESRDVTISTPVALVQEPSRLHPSSGQVMAKGANGSQVRVTAQADGKALVELDANGDNVFETSTLKTWAELRG